MEDYRCEYKTECIVADRAAEEEADTDSDERSTEEARQAGASVATEQFEATHGNASAASQDPEDLPLGSFPLHLDSLHEADAE